MKTEFLNSLGIMQGRLLPKYKGRYQAHPVNYWKDEFAIAKSLNLDYIEFILDFNDAEINPLLSEEGIAEIRKITETSGVKVRSVCADYFMEAPLHSDDKSQVDKSLDILKKLIRNSPAIGIGDIVLPCVDQSSLHTEKERNQLAEILNGISDLAKENQVNIALETDLGPDDFAALLEKTPSKNITVNYDSGNSAALGYRISEEFAAYGQRISDIHIKDRVLGGGSVVLGTGNTDFNELFREISKLRYQGIFVMQVYRDDEGVEIFKKQLDWIKNVSQEFFETIRS